MIQESSSYDDDLEHNLHRYCHADFRRQDQVSDLILKDTDYFMFFLSPLYLRSHLKLGVNKLTLEEKITVVMKQHKIPARPINARLSAIFFAETPLDHCLLFPLDTSILGIFQKP